MLSRGLHPPASPSSSIRMVQEGSERREWLSRNMFTKRFFMVSRLMGEGMGHLLVSDRYRRNRHSGGEGQTGHVGIM